MQIIRNWRKAIFPLLMIIYYLNRVARVRAVGIATRYRVNGPGIESQCGQSFPQQSKTALAPTQPLCTLGAGSFSGIKWPRRGIYHPPSSSTEVKERVNLYIYTSSGPSWSVLVWNLPLPNVQKLNEHWIQKKISTFVKNIIRDFKIFY